MTERLTFSWIYPTAVEAEAVYQLLGRDWRCPWCQRERVAAGKRRLFAPSRWVELAVRSTEPRWVCEGCVIEVYNACNSDDFENHIDRGMVEQVAMSEGVLAEVFRKRCLDDQIALISRSARYKNGSRPEREALEHLLATLRRLLRTASLPGGK